MINKSKRRGEADSLVLTALGLFGMIFFIVYLMSGRIIENYKPTQQYLVVSKYQQDYDYNGKLYKIILKQPDWSDRYQVVLTVTKDQYDKVEIGKMWDHSLPVNVTITK